VLQLPEVNLNQITLPVVNLDVSIAFYRAMGFTQIVGAPAYARFECPEGDATFSVHQVDARPETGVVVYFECTELDRRVADLVARGFTFTQMPQDERWLWREARLLDPSGNVLCLFFAGANRKHPPWRLA
jgi:catechol 2,3-dioxygenase-like lactoylglutathione lyase family enzyme